MLKIFEKILLKNEFLKKRQNFDFSKNRGRIKIEKNNLTFEILPPKTINYHEHI